MFNSKISYLQDRIARLKKATTIRKVDIGNQIGWSYRDKTKSILPSHPLGTFWGNVFWHLEGFFENVNIRNLQVEELDTNQKGTLRKFSISCEFGLYVSPDENGNKISRRFQDVTYECPPSRCVWTDGKPKITAHLKNFFFKRFQQQLRQALSYTLRNPEVPFCTVENFKDQTFEPVQDREFLLGGVVMKVTMDILADFTYVQVKESNEPSENESELTLEYLESLSTEEFVKVVEDFKNNPPKNPYLRSKNFSALRYVYSRTFPNQREIDSLLRLRY